MCVKVVIFLSVCFLPAAYSTPQAGAQGYTQPAQAYGTSSYSSTTAAAPPATQASYGTQPGYTTQSAYSGYGQPAASATQRYRQNFLYEHEHTTWWRFMCCRVDAGLCESLSINPLIFFLPSCFVVTALARSLPTPRGVTRPNSLPTGDRSSPPTLRPHPNSRLLLQPTLLHPMDPTVSLSTASPALLRPATISPDLTVRFTCSRVTNRQLQNYWHPL